VRRIAKSWNPIQLVNKVNLVKIPLRTQTKLAHRTARVYNFPCPSLKVDQLRLLAIRMIWDNPSKSVHNAFVRLFPHWDEIKCFPTPLTAGELHLVTFLDGTLPKDYKIYVQPYVNGLKPDVVVVNPSWGLIVFEVKDWSLGRYRWEGDVLIGESQGNKWRERDPMSQAEHYSRQLFRQFLGVEESTRLAGEETNEFRICLPATYIHGPSGTEVERLFGSYSFGDGHTNLVLHRQNLELSLAIPWTKYKLSRSKYLTDSQSEALVQLHRWLQPIENQSSSSTSKKLTAHQKRLAEPMSGDHRVRGVAGSGKSLVLARRAAKASQEGQVIVTCFNITMSHVLRDLIAKCGVRVDWRNIRVRHIHGLLKDLAIEAGLCDKKNPFNFEETLARCVQRTLSETVGAFRGIYIDEGQDFEADWVDALAALKAKDADLLFMADYRQGLYEVLSAADGRRLKVANFHPGWKELNKTYRLPWKVAYLLNEVAANFALGDESDPVLSDFEPKSSQLSLLEKLIWENCSSLSTCIEKLMGALMKSGAQPSDIAVLVRSHRTGELIVQEIERKEGRFVPIQHVFGAEGPDSEESKRRKHAFWMGRGNLKSCTVHSFKGWELNHIIVIWEGDEASKKDVAELYVALSRALLSIHVINLNRCFDNFSKFEIWDRIG
jgi:hypothetical protein